MRIYRGLAGVLAFLSLGVTGAAAQDGRKTGVTMGYPGSIGIFWDATDKVAIRPEFSFGGSNSKTSPATSFTSETDGWAYGVGVSALFYLHTYDHLRTYLSPRLTFSRATTSGESTGLTGVTTTATVTTKTVGDTTSGALSFGAKYSLGDKFAVFGEVGFGFGHSSTTSSSSSYSQKVTGNTWGTRTGVGVIFYP